MKSIGLITRSGSRGLALQHQLNENGIEALHQPMIKITPCEYDETVLTNLTQAAVIVTSVNAVENLSETALGNLRQAVTEERIAVFSVGSGTQAALMAVGIPSDFPTSQNSEGLIELLADRASAGLSFSSVVLIKGEGGRTLLTDHFRASGRVVVALDIYRREPVESLSEAVVTALRDNQIVWVVCTSVELLQRWADWCSQLDIRSPAVVICSERMREAALMLGIPIAAQSQHCDNQHLANSISAYLGSVTRSHYSQDT